ncbi:hypothetical protein E2C01_044506 [Portunus trituberculatus]|uniref:Uncharacterized protein n=1 Tax=Portunus trituberculatus TaxID=210409 RepID=A0A5B7FZ76_PORTR|nr:hypothetical protein [Portunus trituberculatus]
MLNEIDKRYQEAKTSNDILTILRQDKRIPVNLDRLALRFSPRPKHLLTPAAQTQTRHKGVSEEVVFTFRPPRCGRNTA